MPERNCRFVRRVLVVVDSYMGDALVKGWGRKLCDSFAKILRIGRLGSCAGALGSREKISTQTHRVGDKDTELESRVEFQKLVYISQMTFAKRSAMLPWRRFLVTDAPSRARA